MATNAPSENLFKTLGQTLIVFLTVFALSLVLKSCAAKPIESTHTIEKNTEHHTDSVKSTTINKAIIDSLMIQIAKIKTANPQCDSITQATVDQLLSQLNSRKKSGDNEAGIYYDKVRKRIVAWNKVAQTQSENTATHQQNTTVSTEKEIVKVPVKFIPVWVKILAWIGFGFLIYVTWRIARNFI